MNYQEAIEILKKNKPTSDPRRCGKELCTACDVAISAMQEMQEYKQKLNNAYGECDDLLRTVVDGLVRHEGIEFGTPIKSRILTDDDVDLWEWYRQIGTMEEVREAVEKRKKKKPKGDLHSVPHYRCPNCNSTVKLYQNSKKDEICKWCGQRIEWSEVEDER